VIVDITGPVSVDKSVQDGSSRCSMLEDEQLVAHGPKVPENVVQGTLMIAPRVCCMLPKCSHGKCQVGVHPKHRVHECANHALV
jgi:hypothetical protein